MGISVGQSNPSSGSCCSTVSNLRIAASTTHTLWTSIRRSVFVPKVIWREYLQSWGRRK
jgi:hypothetical protein